MLARVISFSWKKVSLHHLLLFLVIGFIALSHTLFFFVSLPAEAFSTSWTKHFCQYDKRKQKLRMIHYNQTLGKVNLDNDTVISVRECIRRDPDTIDRRFCFDIVSDGDSFSSHSKTSLTSVEKDKDSGTNSNIPNGDSSAPIYTFQALSEDDYKQWMEALAGRDPTPVPVPAPK